MSVTTHEIRASQTAAPVLVQAVEPAPGLLVYLWRLGHHSGLQIAKFGQQADAETAAREIAPLTDWTRSAEDLRANDDLANAVAQHIRHETPGVLTLNPQPTTA
jgi:RecB family exonuclease